MKLEKMVMITGREYQDIKNKIDNKKSFTYNIGTADKPQDVTVTGVYLDTDPEFTHNPGQYAELGEDSEVQVMIEFDGEPGEENASTINT